MNSHSRRVLCVLLTWAFLVEPSLACVLSTEHAFADHGEIEAHLDGGLLAQLMADANQSEATSDAPESAVSGSVSQDHGVHHHGCDQTCHACAHFLGLPTCALPIGFSGISHSVSGHRSTWPSQHRSPPERPPRIVA